MKVLVGIGVIADTLINIGRAMLQAAAEPLQALPVLRRFSSPPVTPDGLCFARRYLTPVTKKLNFAPES
jgi:hypothetical protein